MKINEVERISRIAGVDRMDKSIFKNMTRSEFPSGRQFKVFGSFVSHTGDTITVYKADSGDYYLTDDDRNLLMIVETSNIKYKGKVVAVKIYLLKSARTDKVWASEFYKYLIMKHNLILISDRSQTLSGAKVWDRLARDPQLKTQTILHMWDHEIEARKDKSKIVKAPKSSDMGKYLVWDVPALLTKHFMSKDDGSRYIAFKRTKPAK